jgi:3-oxoacid CoA-transferase A subunit
VGTPLAEGKEQREFSGRTHLLEHGLRADFSLVRAERADPWGNLVYRKTGRNFNPMMATAAQVTVAEVEEIVPVGRLDPETVVTPSIFVHRVVLAPRGR